MLIAKGTLEGRGGHELRGTFAIRKVNGALEFETSADFFFDGSPAPGFAFTTGQLFTAAHAARTDFLRLPGSGSLTGTQIPVSGVQRGVIPATPDFDTFDTVFLWCFQTPFLLGVGAIDRVANHGA